MQDPVIGPMVAKMEADPNFVVTIETGVRSLERTGGGAFAPPLVVGQCVKPGRIMLNIQTARTFPVPSGPYILGAAWRPLLAHELGHAWSITLVNISTRPFRY